MNNSELLEIAEEYGTPTFVFDVREFWQRLDKIADIFGEDVRFCFAMKANPFLAAAAADHGERLEVCSPGELAICEDVGISANQIVYSGVNKQASDIAHAIAYRVGVLTAESKLHVELIEQCAAQAQITVDVLLRLNAGSQFGMSKDDLLEVIDQRESYPHLNIVGLHYFVGTQRKKLKHQIRELEKLRALIAELEGEHGFEVKRLEYGPGLAVPYFADDDFTDDLAPARELAPYIQELGRDVEVTVEMGRFFSASCGTYLTRVADLKENDGTNYCILDGGINHLTYAGQVMGLKVPVTVNLSALADAMRERDERTWTLCGSLCTVNDVLVREVELDSLEMGDVLAFANAGAYSVTEGAHLFLSRTMPRVVLRYDGGCELARDFIETSTLNTPRK
ncbi:MAG: diaminopimelate decarboxylase [Coriobacteriia bacterium]|nr:MAG: diaminopimelate decarboxylase [Coriobacteriia bacterium]